MAREESRGKRPFKLWDGRRSVRKGLVVGSLEELVQRGRDKLGVSIGEPVRLVLESDGTQVEDAEYFRTLAANSVLLLLRPGERWLPAGVDVIRAAISAIPRIVCETIHALELHDETPSWKIMDNKGRVTVVLHWDQRSGTSRASSTDAPSPGPGKFSPSKRPSLVIQTSNAGKKETVINDVYTSQAQPRYPSPQITVINHDEVRLPPLHRLPKQGSSVESATIHIHTPECAHHAHQPRSGSPQSNGTIECDFHCCALHEEGRKIAVRKSVATSPIQDGLHQTSPQTSTRHVHFLEKDVRHSHIIEHESSESETENTVLEDEAIFADKFLMLVDQLSTNQNHHLSIKDIGVILERLDSKIVDVERLEREKKSDDLFYWTIKAVIRGQWMDDLGVIYNGNYYTLCEHPAYKDASQNGVDDVDIEEEEEEEEDRL